MLIKNVMEDENESLGNLKYLPILLFIVLFNQSDKICGKSPYYCTWNKYDGHSEFQMLFKSVMSKAMALKVWFGGQWRPSETCLVALNNQ